MWKSEVLKRFRHWLSPAASATNILSRDGDTVGCALLPQCSMAGIGAIGAGKLYFAPKCKERFPEQEKMKNSNDTVRRDFAPHAARRELGRRVLASASRDQSQRDCESFAGGRAFRDRRRWRSQLWRMPTFSRTIQLPVRRGNRLFRVFMLDLDQQDRLIQTLNSSTLCCMGGRRKACGSGGRLLSGQFPPFGHHLLPAHLRRLPRRGRARYFTRLVGLRLRRLRGLSRHERDRRAQKLRSGQRPLPAHQRRSV